MKQYICTVPLEYIKQSLEDTYDQEGDLIVEVDEMVLEKTVVTLRKGTFESTEECKTSVYTNEGALFLKSDSIYADNEKYAVELLEGLLQRVLPALSYTLHLQNGNKRMFQFKLTYNVRFLSVQEHLYEKYEQHQLQNASEEDGNERYLRLSDHLNFKEHIGMVMTQKFTLENYGDVQKAFSKSFIKQLLTSYTRALGDTDYRSKYFNLFIIIEALEGSYRAHVNQPLLIEEQIKDLIEYIEKWSFFKDKAEIQSTITHRLDSTLKTITRDSRHKKLLTILNEQLGIKKIQTSDSELQIDTSFVKEIIKQRNSLFHAKDLNPEEHAALKSLVFKLILLCEKIILVLIERETEKQREKA